LRARPSALPGSEGRWSLVSRDRSATETERRTARALQLLDRYGVVGREVAKAESMASFGELYPVFRALEEAGKVRRGYFVVGLGGAQFAKPGADEILRRQPRRHAECLVLAATDPANPYGAALPWPPLEPRPQRVPTTVVLLREGYLLAVIAKGDSALSLAFDPDDSENADQLAAVVSAVRTLLLKRKRRLLILETINGGAAAQASCAASFRAAGFEQSANCLCLRRESKDSVDDDDACD
jgi:ATP-dependent Lhr-like helicase